MRMLVMGFALGAVWLIGSTAWAATPAAPDYSDPKAWLCRPGRADACAGDLTATAIHVDGAITKSVYTADPKAPIDCFYVYPTVSREPAANSDMSAGPEEQGAAKMQFARFGAKCRLFAPLYRQVTMAALLGKVDGADTERAYGDVLVAWTEYLAHDNQGRGVVLIGHSQGAKILVRLIAEQIDGKPIQRQLVSAIILGAKIATPKGGLVGGTFQHLPLCSAADQSGCFIGYSTYLAASPPGLDAHFGYDPAPGQVDACVDPAALLGRKALQADFPVVGRLTDMFQTTFIENPDVVLAECARTADHQYLSISFGPGSGVLEHDLSNLQAREPSWGLHVLDMNIALGDLVELVGRQSAAWALSKPAS